MCIAWAKDDRRRGWGGGCPQPQFWGSAREDTRPYTNGSAHGDTRPVRKFGHGPEGRGYSRSGGFTLLEVTLAVAILAMMSLAIYRFVQTNLIAIRVSSEASAADARYDGLRDLLTAQWQ